MDYWTLPDLTASARILRERDLSDAPLFLIKAIKKTYDRSDRSGASRLRGDCLFPRMCAIVHLTEYPEKAVSGMNEYEKEHASLIRRFGAECAVLLKSDGAFPLPAPCELALYGSGARRTVRGGTGSGEVNSRSSVTAEEGFRAAGFTVTTGEWLDRYDELWAQAHREFILGLKKQARAHHTLAILESMGAVMPEPEYDLSLNGAGTAAVYVLSRVSGEGSDRQPVPGDILLTETEKRDILRLSSQYEKFLLVLNVGGVVDLSPVMDVGNILLLSQLGAETGNILADLVLGRSVPSGRLTTTWAAWDDYPRHGSFGDKDDTRYREGIYVGYRAFDSEGRKPLFPFGFGLGYSTFSVAAGETTEDRGRVSVRAVVRNTGAFPGKETVQLYVSAPQGRLGKPYQALAAFAKTSELSSGGSEEVTLTFDLRDQASYDEERAAWVLEPGDYVLRLGTSSADTDPAAVLRMDGEAVVGQCRNCLGKPDFADLTPPVRTEEAPRDVPVLAMSASSFEARTVDYVLTHEVDPLIDDLGDEELCSLGIGAFDPRLGALSVIGNASKAVAGAAGETTGTLKAKGIPPLVMADGPAGLRLSRQYTVGRKGVRSLDGSLPESMLELMPTPVAAAMKLLSGLGRPRGEVREQYCTALPIGTALAQSWNTELAERCGDIVGAEMERFGVHLWLAPAMNIHRDIRCGRNFEYFSEDPLISGRFAAALARGVQKHPGRGVTLKHFAANNQETNRYNSNSQVSERAMREIYLRGFGIAVREGMPCALMTSYNLLNGVHTSERRDLIEDILRAEFGFEGIVMTDWIVGMTSGKGNRYPGPDAALIAAAGNDLTMPGSMSDYKAMLRGLKSGSLKRRQLRINATRIYRTAQKFAGG